MPSKAERKLRLYDMPIYHYVSNQTACWHLGCLFGGGPLKHGDRVNGRENYKISISLRTVALVQERCSCGQVNQWLCLAFRRWWDDVAHSAGQCYDRHGTCLEMALKFVVWSSLLARLFSARCKGLATSLRSRGMEKNMKSILSLFVVDCVTCHSKGVKNKRTITRRYSRWLTSISAWVILRWHQQTRSRFRLFSMWKYVFSIVCCDFVTSFMSSFRGKNTKIFSCCFCFICCCRTRLICRALITTRHYLRGMDNHDQRHPSLWLNSELLYWYHKLLWK